MHTTRSFPALLLSALLGLALAASLAVGAVPGQGWSPTSASAQAAPAPAAKRVHRHVILTSVLSRRGGAEVRLVVREVRRGHLVQRKVREVRVVRGRTPVRITIRSAYQRARFRVVLRTPHRRPGDAFDLGRVKVGRPPVVAPQPPTEQPPTEQPPTEQPPTEQPPTEQPPTEQPPTEQPPTEEPPVEEPPTGAGKLSNGCAYGARGLPSCGAYLGMAYGSNQDPTTLEQEYGRRLGVRRTYYTASQVDGAVRTATTDLRAGRLPWISFKLPHGWTAMADGQGDAWARNLVSRFDALDGPVWLAFHHEPEGDGDIKEWTRMQERLGPIVRAADNVAFTVVVTGWHQFYGDAQYRLPAMWPDTRVDVAGFDIYNQLGVVKDGKENTKGTDLNSAYFSKIATWAKAEGVAWGLAETGITHKGATLDPTWIRDTYRELDAAGGIAFAYFNTPLNSIAPWELTTQEKRADWRVAQGGTPLIPARQG